SLREQSRFQVRPRDGPAVCAIGTARGSSPSAVPCRVDVHSHPLPSRARTVLELGMRRWRLVLLKASSLALLGWPLAALLPPILSKEVKNPNKHSFPILLGRRSIYVCFEIAA